MAYEKREVKILHQEELFISVKAKVVGTVKTFGDDKAGWASVALLEDYKLEGKWYAKKEFTTTELAYLTAMAARMQLKAMTLYTSTMNYVPPKKTTGDPMKDAINASYETDDIPF